MKATNRLNSSIVLLFIAVFITGISVCTTEAGTFSFTGSMSTPRQSATATLISGCNCPADGKVLIAGGVTDGLSGTTNTAELYDPATGTFTLTGSMNVARGGQTAALMPGGKVLVIGASNSPSPADAEIYDPMAGTFSCVAGTDPVTGYCNPTVAHNATSASLTLLVSGKVLVAGLQTIDSGGQYSKAAAIYDLSQNIFTCVDGLSSEPLICNPSMVNSHGEGTATLLANEKVLIAGGHDFNANYTNIAEIYDPNDGPDGGFTTTDGLITGRGNHTATLLNNAQVLIAGGSGDSGTLHSAEIYNPDTSSFTAVGDMSHERFVHTSTLLNDGTVLVAGGCCLAPNLQLPYAEIYDPTTEMFEPTDDMNNARALHIATLVANGLVLVAGGFQDSTAELYSTSFIWPVEPSASGEGDRCHVSQGYAEYNDVVTNFYHTGLDIEGAGGEPVLATAGGDVVFLQGNDIGCNEGTPGNCSDHGFGNTVIVKHSSVLFSQYSHLLEIEALLKTACGFDDTSDDHRKICDPPVPINSWQQLGKVGGSGYGDANRWGKHLHFEAKSFDTLGTISNDASADGIFGYTSRHPDRMGYKNPIPILQGLNAYNIPLIVQSTENLNLRVGPSGGSTLYRYIKVVNASEEEYAATGSLTDMVSRLNCAGQPESCSEWYQIHRIKREISNENLYFTDISIYEPGEFPEAWACADSFQVVGLPDTDNFEDSDISNWSFKKGIWSASNGSLVGTTNKKADAYAPFAVCSNCVIETEFEIRSDGGQVSILSWFIDKKNLVELAVFHSKQKWVLKHRVGGKTIAKAKFVAEVNLNTKYRVALSYDGSVFSVYLDGLLIITMPAGTVSTGKTGFRVKSTTGLATTASFDVILVYP